MTRKKTMSPCVSRTREEYIAGLRQLDEKLGDLGDPTTKRKAIGEYAASYMVSKLPDKVRREHAEAILEALLDFPEDAFIWVVGWGKRETSPPHGAEHCGRTHWPWCWALHWVQFCVGPVRQQLLQRSHEFQQGHREKRKLRYPTYPITLTQAERLLVSLAPVWKERHARFEVAILDDMFGSRYKDVRLQKAKKAKAAAANSHKP